jgi:hypothetical protein
MAVLGATAGAIVVLATTVGLTGWFRGSSRADKHAATLVRFGGTMGPRGCSYLFHDSFRYQVLTGLWKGRVFRWDKRSQQQGHWTAQQQRAVHENATVDAGGLLKSTEHPGSSNGCFKAWNRLPPAAWQRTVARNFEAAWVVRTEAVS